MDGTALQSYEFGPEEFRELLRDSLVRGVSMRFAAAGTSMDPFIKDGDIVTVAPLTDGLRPGEIVAAVSPANGLVVVHRVVALRNGSALLKGDNLPAADGEAAGAALLGRVVRAERGGRQVVLGVGEWNWALALLSRWKLLRHLARAVSGARRLAGRRPA